MTTDLLSSDLASWTTRATLAPGGGLRVAIVSDAIYPYNKGGKELRYHEIGRRLAASGMAVDVYTMHWWEGPKTHSMDGVRYHAICPKFALYSGNRRSIPQAIAFSIACLRLMRRKFDVIEADHMPYLPLFTLRLVAWLKGCSLIVSWHEVWGRDYWRKYLGIAGVVAATIERVAMRLPDHIIADVVETRRRLQACNVDRDSITVVPVGIDVATFDAIPASPQHFDVIFVGRLLEHKGVDVLVAAIAHSRDNGRLLTCAVVGEGPELDRLQARSCELGLAGQITFLGRVESHAEVWGLMKSAGVLALPSVREGFGIVVLEALACGIPIVTSDHSDNQARLLVEHGATGIVCPCEAAAFAGGLLQMIDARPNITAMRDTALGPYDWDTIITSVHDVYRRCTVRIPA